MMRSKSLVALLAAVLVFARTAEAGDDRSESSPKRVMPDYDGRGQATSGDGAVWIPRVILSPLYFTSEFILRRPLGAITIALERADLFRKIYDFFVFGKDHKAGIVPVMFAEFGFNPSIGLYGFWDDAFHMPGNQLRIHYEAWFDDWLAGSITDRIPLGPRSTLQVRAAAMHRPDQVFYGMGPNSLKTSQSRYAIARFDASAAIENHPFRSSTIEGAFGVRSVDLAPGHYGDDPSLEQEARTGAFPIPFGFNRGYIAPYGRLQATLDTRPRGQTTGSGFRLEAQAEEGVDVQHSPSSGWLRYGGVATALVDLNDRGRVLSVSVAALFADPLGPEPVPFTELVALGGDKWMIGYFTGRLVDRSAAVAAVHYDWPIGPWLNGSLRAVVGNVFGEHLSGFQVGSLRFSGGIGISTATATPFEVLVGIGTDTFDRGANIDSLRVVVGVPHSF